MSLAKAVANAAAMLVLKAKNVAQVAEDTVLQNRVIAAATQCALSTSQLVACAKVGLGEVVPKLCSLGKKLNFCKVYFCSAKELLQSSQTLQKKTNLD